MDVSTQKVVHPHLESLKKLGPTGTCSQTKQLQGVESKLEETSDGCFLEQHRNCCPKVVATHFLKKNCVLLFVRLDGIYPDLFER